MVVDGLGHGEGAYEAAQEASRFFHLYKNSDLSLTDLMQKIHLALTKTRGAAIALARIDRKNQKLEYTAIGNIATVLQTPQKRQSLISFGGIMGHYIRKVQNFSYTLPQRYLIIMQSDGLKTNWDLKYDWDVFHKPAAIIAGLIYQHYKRGRDDATVLVIKGTI